MVQKFTLNYLIKTDVYALYKCKQLYDK